jgi:hypothetical protein
LVNITDRYTTYIIVFTIVVVIAILWVAVFLDIKMDYSAFPTLVNGITSSTSIILGLSGAIIGIMLRDGEVDKGTKNFYYIAMVLLLLPITMLWMTYSFLASGKLGSWLSYEAVRVALSGLIFTLYLFFGIVLRTIRSASMEHPTSLTSTE